MLTRRILIAIVFLIFIGCKENNTEIKSNETDTAKIQKTNNLPTNQNNLDGFVKESFVISCGSGCAISYSPINIKQIDHKIEVKFNIEIYEDEVVTDNYNETYTFIYDDKYNLIKVKSEDDNKNYLDSLSSAARESFVDFGQSLINSLSGQQSSKTQNQLIPESNPKKIKLPFSFYQYFNDNFSETFYPGYEATPFLKDFLKSKDYEGKTYKSFVIRADENWLYLIVSVARGDSEYFVLITSKNNSIIDYKEIGAIGGENAVTFKVFPNFTIEKYNGNGEKLTAFEKLKINENGKIVKE